MLDAQEIARGFRNVLIGLFLIGAAIGAVFVGIVWAICRWLV